MELNDDVMVWDHHRRQYYFWFFGFVAYSVPLVLGGIAWIALFGLDSDGDGHVDFGPALRLIGIVGFLVSACGLLHLLGGPAPDLPAELADVSEEVRAVVLHYGPFDLRRARPFPDGRHRDDAGEVRLIVPMLDWEGYVTLAFDDHVILQSVSFTLLAGHTKIILGASGAGKSTILKLILGLLRPDGGVIWVNGARVDQLDPDEEAPPADFLDDLRILERRGELVPQAGASDADPVDQRSLLDQVEHREPHGRGQRRAVPRVPEVELARPAVDRVIDLLPDQDGSERCVPRAEALADGHDVGLDRQLVRGQPASDPADAGH